MLSPMVIAKLKIGIAKYGWTDRVGPWEGTRRETARERGSEGEGARSEGLSVGTTAIVVGQHDQFRPSQHVSISSSHFSYSCQSDISAQSGDSGSAGWLQDSRLWVVFGAEPVT